MSIIMQQGTVLDEVRSTSHYHWNSLCKSQQIFGQCTVRLANIEMTEHGKPDEARSQQQPQNKLSNQLIGLFSLVHHIRVLTGD